MKILRDELLPWVRDNLVGVVTYAREHQLEDKEFDYGLTFGTHDKVTWPGPEGHQITMRGDHPFTGLVEEGLLHQRHWHSGSVSGTSYTITARGFQAVDENFEILSLYAAPQVDVQIGDRITVGDIINSGPVAIGPESIAIQVKEDLGSESAELRAAIEELTHALEDTPTDRPNILSALNQVITLLIKTPDAIEAVAPIIAFALRAVGLLP
jgi:hypothetical protein